VNLVVGKQRNRIEIMSGRPWPGLSRRPKSAMIH
jgi:hypothetical protein